MLTRVLTFALAFCLPAFASKAQEAELVGTLHTVWRDPIRRGDAPVRMFSVTDDSGRVTPLALTESQAAAYGGFDALNLRRVRVAVAGGRATALREVQPRTSSLRAFLSADGPRRMRYVTLLCKFPDLADVTPGTLADAEVNFGQSYPGAGHYWSEVSNGQLSLEGSIVRGWYTMTQPRSTNVPGSYANLDAVARDCAAAADADVDFSQFQGVNFVFNYPLDCCSYGGSGSLSLDGGVRSYAMTWLAPVVFQGLGTISHEIGHSLGLGHSSGSYGLVYDSRWDVMSSSDWAPVPGTAKFVSAHVNAYGKRQLNFIPADRDFLATPGTHEILLERSASPGANENYLVARIPTPRFGSMQYYTLEARGIGGYDAPLVGAGVVVHRVGGGSSKVIDPDGDFDPNDEGALLTPGEEFRDPLHGITVRVIERVGNAFRLRLDVAASPMVTLASPQRLYRVTAGSDSVIVDSALVTLIGMGEQAGWTAGKLMSGPLSVATTSGTGNATLRWSLRTAGLADGVYDQDIRVAASGSIWTDLRIRLVVEATVEPMLAVLAPSRRDSLIAGVAREAFNPVTVSGVGSDTTRWIATTSAPWITMVQDTGTGSGMLRYRRETSGLAPGMYVAQLTLSAPGATLAPLALIDSLEVLESLSWRVVQRGSTRETVIQGALPNVDSMRVELDGRHGNSSQWYAIQRGGQYYFVPEFPGPVGSGWVRFRRTAGDLEPGIYPARIRVNLGFDPSQEFFVEDTLVVTAAPVGIALSTTVTRDSVRGVSSLSEDSVFVQPTGPGSSNRRWRVVNTRALLAFPFIGGVIPNERVGPGWLRFIRNLSGRAPGWHVDTLTFLELNGSVVLARMIDSLYVAPGPMLTTLATSAARRRSELRAGSARALEDTVLVIASGDEAEQVPWTAATSSRFTALITSSGNGTAALRWSRSAAGLAPGWHVDTIRVSAVSVGASTMIVDSLWAYAALAVSGATQRPAAMMGAPFADTLRSSGGPTAPPVWSIADGALPAGLTFNAALARVQGIAETSGSFTVTVRAVAGADTALRALEFVVAEPTLAASAVVEQLLGGTPLSEDQRRYLDLQGNRNGRPDIGDVRAWRRRQASTLTAAQRAEIDSVIGSPTPEKTP